MRKGTTSNTGREWNSIWQATRTPSGISSNGARGNALPRSNWRGRGRGGEQRERDGWRGE